MAYLKYLFFNKTKKLYLGLKHSGGRNFQGRVCIRGQGGGNKRIYRYLDFFRRLNQNGFVLRVYSDPNRTGKIMLIQYKNGLQCFSLLQEKININDIIYSGSIDLKESKNLCFGDSLPLKIMPLFSVLSNIEIKPFSGSTLCRAGGVSAVLIGKTKEKAILKLNSGWQFHLDLNCISSFGVGQRDNELSIGSAGKNRALGVRPKVRGVAQNPCDHPHGGGNGKKSKPVVPTNAWSTVFKWKHTKNKKYEILNRRKYKDLKSNK